MAFAGMDCSIYPGDAVMDALRTTTNLKWCGFYLAPAPSHPDSSWMARRPHLANTGWGFAPLYLGQQDGAPGSHVLTTQRGQVDADNARLLAKGAGFPTGTTIFLDIEQGGNLSGPNQAYVAAWLDTLKALDYVPGIYCSHTTVESVKALGLDAVYWIYKFNNSDSGVTKTAPFKDDDPDTTGVDVATVWQWAQNCKISTVSGLLLVDLDTASTADPSSGRAP